MADKELKGRVASVKNVQKITRAMEMISAARLRRAEQRIESLRPYASAIRRMTRHAAQAAEHLPSLPILDEHENVQNVGLMLVTSDRGLAGAFNGQIIRAGVSAAAELERDGQGRGVLRLRPPRRRVADLPQADAGRRLRRVHRPPVVRQRARDRGGPDHRLRRRRRRPGRRLLQQLHLAAAAAGHARDAAAAAAGDDPRARPVGRGRGAPSGGPPARRARRVRARSRSTSSSG